MAASTGEESQAGWRREIVSVCFVGDESMCLADKADDPVATATADEDPACLHVRVFSGLADADRQDDEQSLYSSAYSDKDAGEEENVEHSETEQKAGTGQWIVVALTFTASFFFSGIIFGWAPLQLMMEEDGIYSSLCPVDEPKCIARTERLFFLFTLGSTVSVIAPTPAGFFVDLFGPKVCSIASGLVMASGLFLLGISQDDGLDAFALGSMLIGFGGSFVQMTSFPAAFIMPESRRAFVLTGINCLFDASSVSFLFVYLLYSKAGMSRRMILIIYAAACIATHVALFIAWSFGASAHLSGVQQSEVDEQHAAKRSRRMGVRLRDEKSSVMNMGNRVSFEELREHEPDGTKMGRAMTLIPLRGKPLKQQLKTFEFLFVVVFLPCMLMRSNAYLGTNKQLLEDLGDADTGYTYTQIFIISLPASTVCCPLINICLSKYGFGGSFIVIMVLGITWNAAALVENLPIQLISFSAFTNFRAFLFSVYFIYLAATFGSRTSGRVHGLVVIVATVLNFLLWPLTTLARSLADGNGSGLNYLYAAMLLLCVPVLALVMNLQRKLSRNPSADCRRKAAPPKVSKKPSEQQQEKSPPAQQAGTTVEI